MEDVSTTSSPSGPLPQSHDHHVIDERDEALEIDQNNDLRESYQIQIPIRIPDLTEIQDMLQEIFSELLIIFRQPMMDSKTLIGASIFLLLFDRFLICVSGMVDTLLLAIVTTSAKNATTSTHKSMESSERSSNLQDMARAFVTTSIEFFLNGSDYSRSNNVPHGDNDATIICSPGEACDEREASSSIAGQALLLATALAILANTSYFGMLVTPLYSRIMDATRTSFPTEFLLAMLLFLFGVEIVTVLAFFLLGYKVILSPTEAARMLDSSSGGGLGMLMFGSADGMERHNSDTVVLDSNQQQQRVDLDATGTTIHLLLLMSTII